MSKRPKPTQTSPSRNAFNAVVWDPSAADKRELPELVSRKGGVDIAHHRPPRHGPSTWKGGTRPRIGVQSRVPAGAVVLSVPPRRQQRSGGLKTPPTQVAW